MIYALAIHGGAYSRPQPEVPERQALLRKLIGAGRERLDSGATALDVVTAMVRELEISGLFRAGRGSSPNTDGVVELDASIMDGASKRAGAVAAIRRTVNPIEAARAVMEDGRHVMLAGEGAQTFVEAHGLEIVADPTSYYGRHREAFAPDESDAQARHGTVGAVALDQNGHLAAATSTGGLLNKVPGRVGDSPIIGAGTWADELVAVSCTGAGEYFIRTCAAHTVSVHLQFRSASLDAAARAALDGVAELGGTGGLIAVDRTGRIAMPYNAAGMSRAAASAESEPEVFS